MVQAKKESPAKKKRPQKATGPLANIFKSGTRRQKGFLALYWSRTKSDDAKLYLGVSKRLLAKAHDRNRAKRLIREIVRKWLDRKKLDRDIMVRLMRSPQSLSMVAFRENLEPLLKHLEL